MREYFFLFSFFISLFCNGQSILQDIIGSAGNNFTTGVSRVSWTMGETITETFSTTDNTVTQGFHQPNETALSVSLIQPQYFEIQLFPNPTDGKFIINLQSKEEIHYRIYNVFSQLVTEASLLNGINYIDINHHANGLYILKVCTVNETNYKNYKIYKTR